MTQTGFSSSMRSNAVRLNRVSALVTTLVLFFMRLHAVPMHETTSSTSCSVLTYQIVLVVVVLYCAL